MHIFCKATSKRNMLWNMNMTCFLQLQHWLVVWVALYMEVTKAPDDSAWQEQCVSVPTEAYYYLFLSRIIGCGCFVTSITMWLTFCQYEVLLFTIRWLLWYLMLSPLNYIVNLFLFLWSEYNWALLINVIEVSKTVQNAYLATLKFRKV